MTHEELITHAAAWLASQGCAVVITDMAHGTSETPDAIGWRGMMYSSRVECKASRSDFKADARKSFRRRAEEGMGYQRYYCTPPGLIPVSALPAGWGLLEWTGRMMSKIVTAPHTPENNPRAEINLLLSCIRRIAHTPLKGVSVRCYTIESLNRASLGVALEDEEEPTSRGQEKI